MRGNAIARAANPQTNSESMKHDLATATTTFERIALAIRHLHENIRDELVYACETTAQEQLSRIEHDRQEDTIYAIDRISEERIIDYFTQEIAPIAPVVLIAEGIGDGEPLVLPQGTPAAQARFRIIIDPIDGTRALMYQKRSGWILTGIAPNKGPATNLQDIEFAIQTEVPLVKQHLSDVLYAFRGRGVTALRHNRLNGESRPFKPQPSRATTIAHGFAMVVRFFPGARDVLAQIDEKIVEGSLGKADAGRATCFEDQYPSSSGQLYELICGHDRFVADLRPLINTILAARGQAPVLCCHPYDLCTELIAREAGVSITGPDGQAVRPSLNVTEGVAWIGYANEQIRQQVEPHLRSALREHRLL